MGRFQLKVQPDQYDKTGFRSEYDTAENWHSSDRNLGKSAVLDSAQYPVWCLIKYAALHQMKDG